MELAEEKNISGSAFLTFPSLKQYGLFCGFTSRAKGYSKKQYSSLNLAFHIGDDRESVKRNRQLVLNKLLKKNRYNTGATITNPDAIADAIAKKITKFDPNYRY